MPLNPELLRQTLADLEAERTELVAEHQAHYDECARLIDLIDRLHPVITALQAVVVDYPIPDVDIEPSESDIAPSALRISVSESDLAATIVEVADEIRDGTASIPAGTDVDEAVSALVTPLITDPKEAAAAMDRLLSPPIDHAAADRAAAALDAAIGDDEDPDWMPHGMERAMDNASAIDTVGDAVLATGGIVDGERVVRISENESRSVLEPPRDYKPTRQKRSEQIAREGGTPATNAGYDPAKRDRKQTRRYKILEVMVGVDKPLTSQEIAVTLSDRQTLVHAELGNMQDDHLVEKIGVAWTTTLNAPKVLEAIRDNQIVPRGLPDDLMPLDPGDEQQAVCPFCTRMRLADALGWKVAGGRRRLMFQCEKCKTKFHNDVPPEPWLKERT